MVQLYSEIEQLLEKYKFTFPDLSERLKCIICHEVLKNAHQATCGCKFCRKCLVTYLKNESKQCPSKLIDCENVILNLKNVYKDNATNKEIINMISSCPFEQCSFTGRLLTMSQHINECKYQEISCIDCNKKILKTDSQHHQTNDCDMRIVKCNMCDKEFTYKLLMEIHLNMDDDDVCHQLNEKCPNNCEIDGIVNIKDHLKVCSNRKVYCPFHIFNCTKEKMTQTCLLKHITEEHLSHVQILIGRISHLENSVENLTDQLVVLQNLITEQEVIIKTTNETILEMKKSNKIQEAPNISTINNVNNKSDFICNDSCFIWKIENIRDLKRKVQNRPEPSEKSIPFYINQFGYRLCLKVYPHGDGIGRTTHFSIFFVIMKGKYDDVLTWPFQQNINLSLLAQNGKGNHHTETLRPDSKSSCYEKPVEEQNIGSGSPKFISQNDLFKENSIYCQNDTIFIKITIG